MSISGHPAQEPLSPFGLRHHQLMARRNAHWLAEDYAYGPAAGQHELVFYRAQSTQNASPLLVFFHGGGWTNGYKEYASFMGPLFAMSGIAFATAGYRLAPAHVFPAGWQDCSSALAWCYENHDALGIARNRIFVGGFSAGAHYASLLATRRDWQRRHGLPQDVIRGCLPISGSYCFGENAGFTQRPRFLGDPALGHEHAASPLCHVDGQAPPFHVSWGEWDFPHLIEQARQFTARLRSCAVGVTALELPERDHLGAGLAAGEIQGPWYASARAWLEEVCGKGDNHEKDGS